MDARARLREAAASWNQPQALSVAQADADVARARGDLESALQGFGVALLRDAQVRMGVAMTGMRRRVDDAEIELELLVARVPAIGPRIAMGLYGRTHPAGDASEADGWPSRPSNHIDPDDVAREDAEAQADYLDCIGVHMA